MGKSLKSLLVLFENMDFIFSTHMAADNSLQFEFQGFFCTHWPPKSLHVCGTCSVFFSHAYMHANKTVKIDIRNPYTMEW